MSCYIDIQKINMTHHVRQTTKVTSKGRRGASCRRRLGSMLNSLFMIKNKMWKLAITGPLWVKSPVIKGLYIQVMTQSWTRLCTEKMVLVVYT